MHEWVNFPVSKGVGTKAHQCKTKIQQCSLNHPTVQTVNSCTKCMGIKYMTAHLIATQFPGLGCMDYLTTKHSFD